MFSRRDFLKLSALSLASLASTAFGPWPPGEISRRGMLGRVARSFIYVYSQPDLDSPRLGNIERDELLDLLELVVSPYGPDYNPRWYRIDAGFVHSAYIQRVENSSLNMPLSSIPYAGLLGEITVPLTQSYYKDRQGAWKPLYRLYFQSLHWITSLVEASDADSPSAGQAGHAGLKEQAGLEGRAWYILTDEWLKLQYAVPAQHVHPLALDEMAPLSPDVPAAEKRIHISIETQTLTAYEGEQAMLETRVSTGKRYMETPCGDFFVNRKLPSRHMGDGYVMGAAVLNELVGVPWVAFFHTNGVALHGAYWHDNFGAPTSQGCVNIRIAEARWLFRWCTPTYDAAIPSRKGWKVTGKGTAVKVE